MKKARSRLSLANDAPKGVELSASQATPVVERKKTTQMGRTLRARLKHLPTLFIGLFFVFLLLGLTIIFSPDQLKNFVLPNTYLPFFVCFFMASFFLLSWFLLDSLVGMWWAIWLTCLIFFRVQQVVFGGPELIIFTVGFVIGVLMQMWRRLIHHQN